MSDSLRLYRTIIAMILNTRVHFHDMRCLITFAWAIVGVLLEKSVHLSKWGIHRAGKAKAASKQRQFVRWLKNAKIEHTEIYRHLVKTIFVEWGKHTIYLALDSSSLWDEFVIVRIALSALLLKQRRSPFWVERIIRHRLQKLLVRVTGVPY